MPEMNTSTEYFSDIFTGGILFESGEEKQTRVKVKIPLMHVGANKKNFEWTPETLKKIVPMFKSVPFKYDVDGSQGSSHVPEHLYSPYYDVGWTTDAYYDGKDTFWVEGEVTHPDVAGKIQRQTSDGKRELNYASMGVLLDPDQTACGICGTTPAGSCGHVRGEEYNGKVCTAVPLGIKKALHVALTNDPADGVAAITQAIFQEARLMEQMETAAQDPTKLIKSGDTQKVSQLDEGKANAKNVVNLDKPGMVATAQGGAGPINTIPNAPEVDKDKVVKALADRMGAVEQTLNEVKGQMAEQQKKQDKQVASLDNPQGNVSPKYGAPSTQYAEPGMVKCPSCGAMVPIGGAQAQAQGQAQADAAYAQGGQQEEQQQKQQTADVTAPPAKHKEVTQFIKHGDNPKESTEAENYHNKMNTKHLNEPGMVATADDGRKSALLAEVADMTITVGGRKDVKEVIMELADKSVEQLETIKYALKNIPSRGRREFADQMIPEYGAPATQSKTAVVEIADMSADERSQKFGHVGKWDVLFHPERANQYGKK